MRTGRRRRGRRAHPRQPQWLIGGQSLRCSPRVATRSHQHHPQTDIDAQQQCGGNGSRQRYAVPQPDFDQRCLRALPLRRKHGRRLRTRVIERSIQIGHDLLQSRAPVGHHAHAAFESRRQTRDEQFDRGGILPRPREQFVGELPEPVTPDVFAEEIDDKAAARPFGTVLANVGQVLRNIIDRRA